MTVPESPMFNAPEAAIVTVPRLELVWKPDGSMQKPAKLTRHF